MTVLPDIQVTRHELPHTLELIIFSIVIITPLEHPECDSFLRTRVFLKKVRENMVLNYE